MAVVRLPVAGLDVVLRPLAGAEDILLVEAGPLDMALAVELLGRVACGAGGAALDAPALSISDVDVLLLRLRQRLLGDVVSAEGTCPADDCGARVDVTFSIAAYLEHHLPAVPEGVAPAGEAGWWRLAGGEAEFRLPRAEDQLAVARAADPEEALLRRCVRPAEVGEEVRRQVEAAMEVVAPSLYSELTGTCPECGATVAASFEPLRYTLRELRDQAAFIYEDVCAIAHHFHWSESDILALPAPRRARYAELAETRLARQALRDRDTA
jgi:hypothetical protein